MGSSIMGWSVLDPDAKQANGLNLVDYGVVVTDKDLDVSQRLVDLYQKLLQVIDHYQPKQAAIESLFFSKNQKTVMTVSQARGVILLACVQKGLRISEYTPLQVKQALTGYGRAEKQQIQQMVKAVFGLAEVPKPDDAADAVAIGVCHWQHSQSRIIASYKQS